MTNHEKLLTAARRVYAAQMVAMAGAASNSRLRAAFAKVKREKFLDPPWFIPDTGGAHELQSRDPVILYQDLLFTIKAEKHINNGSPSLHAWGLNRLDVEPGETVLHLGTGTGYYTALMSALAGKNGTVLGIEAEIDLANISRKNLKRHRNVHIDHGNGSDWPKSPVDAIYVNYAVPRPMNKWLSGLRENGRIIFPLGVPATDNEGKFEPYTKFGGFIYAKRRGSKFVAQWLGATTFVYDSHFNDNDYQECITLEAAFKSGGIEHLSEIRMGEKTEKNEWFSARDWGLIIKK